MKFVRMTLSWIFAVAGTILLVGAILLCFASKDSSTKILENPEGAIACSDRLQACLEAGDLDGVGKLLYGTPDLGAAGTPEDPCAARLWQAYCESLSLTYHRLCLVDGELCREGELTVLNVAGVTEGMQRRARAALAGQSSGEEGETAPPDSREILMNALEDALREDGETIRKDVSVKLIFRDGQWWAIPDGTFWKTLTTFGQ